MEEKRKFVRFKAPFCIRYADKMSSQEAPGIIKDISYGGARILLDTPLDIFSSRPVSLSILFPKDTLKVSGKVVWVKSSGDLKEVGVCFENMPDSFKDTIYNYIIKYFKEEFNHRWGQ